MSLVDCQLSLDVIGYEDLNVISSFLSVFLSQLNSHSLLVKLSVISHFCPCQFCLSLSIVNKSFTRYEYGVDDRWLS